MCKILRKLLFFLAALALPCHAVLAADPALFKEGDLIFQSLNTPQSLAIRIATKSDYTHCGIVFKKDEKLYVFEAIQPVSWTLLDTWIARGEGGHYLLMRLKNRENLLDAKTLAALKQSGLPLLGKPYDLYFQWSDDKIYCSELIWKVFQRGAGIELCPLKTFADFDLDHELVRKIARERYKTDLPLDEKVVAPSDLIESDLLEVVSEGR